MPFEPPVRATDWVLVDGTGRTLSEVQPVVETVRPQEQVQPKQEVVQMQAKPVEPQEVHKTEPVVQAVAPAEVQREAAAVVEQQVMEAAPVTAQTYQAQSVVNAPAAPERTRAAVPIGGALTITARLRAHRATRAVVDLVVHHQRARGSCGGGRGPDCAGRRGDRA